MKQIEKNNETNLHPMSMFVIEDEMTIDNADEVVIEITDMEELDNEHQ